MKTLDKNETVEAKSSLESIASPEGLDRLMRVVKPKDFIPVATIGGLSAIAIIWSIIGRIPVAVDGRGILISSQPVIELQSPIAGQLKSLSIKENSCVKKGEILATIQPLELETQLQQQQSKRQQLLAQRTESNKIQSQRMRVEQNAISANRASLDRRLKDLRTLNPVMRQQTLANIEQQRQVLQQRLQDKESLATITKQRDSNALLEQRRSLQQKLQDLKQLAPILNDRFLTRQKLQAAGGINADTVLEARNADRENRNQISTLETQLSELKSKELEIEKSFRENKTSIADINAQIKQLDSQKITTEKSFLDNRGQASELEAQIQSLNTRYKQLEQENLQATNTRQNDIAEVERTIAQTKQQIAERSQIRSPQSGCILELGGAVGQVVNPGTRFGTLQSQTSGSTQINAIMYFDVKDGKRIKPGMTMQITPDTVKRERFGGIVATVKSVSSYPVTSSTVATKVGNAELAESLTGKTAKVEIVANLGTDDRNPSGYQWSSSKGPNLKLTAGTTTNVKVNVEEQAPIAYLLPFLREWSGIK
jgi:HlyD family secretion protein